MTGTRIRNLLVASAAIAVLAAPAIAADLDDVVYSDDANFAKPVEIGSGWYLRGDVSWNFGARAERGFEFIPELGDSVHTDYADRFGFGVGFGQQYTKHLRWDATVERPLGSGFEVLQGRSFAGTRATDFVTTDANGNTVTEERQVAFNANGVVYYSENPTIPVGTVLPPVAGSEEIEAGYSMWTLMANGYYDLSPVWGVTPYVGAGIGAARMNWFERRTVDCVPNEDEACTYPPGMRGTPVEDFVIMDRRANSWVPAFAVTAGGSFDVTPNLKFDANYRFLVAKAVDKIEYNDGTPLTDDAVSLHQFRVGLRYLAW